MEEGEERMIGGNLRNGRFGYQKTAEDLTSDFCSLIFVFAVSRTNRGGNRY